MACKRSTLTAGSTDDVVVTLDGGIVQHVALGKDMPVDPGTHVVEARNASRKPFEQRFELREGERRTIALADFTEAPTPEGPKPDKIVVDPNPASNPREEEAPKPGRWLFEPGAFVGYLSLGNTARVGNQADLKLEGAGNATTTCNYVSCSYSASRKGAVAGANIFGGYALSERSHLGARLLAGPELEGGWVVALGPSISFEVTNALWLGAWGFFGAASVSTKGYASAAGYTSNATTISFEVGGIGGGLEVSLRLLTLPHGRLLANATPFFMLGDGSAWSIPLGVAYQFQ